MVKTKEYIKLRKKNNYSRQAAEIAKKENEVKDDAFFLAYFAASCPRPHQNCLVGLAN